MQELLEFHISHNYYTKIQPLPKMNGCIANFPPNLFLHIPHIERTYIINEDPPCVELYHKENNKTTTEKINVEKYEVRLLVLKDVLFRTVERGLSTKLIIVEGTEKGDIFSLLEMNMTKEELELERNLCVEFRNLLSKGL